MATHDDEHLGLHDELRAYCLGLVELRLAGPPRALAMALELDSVGGDERQRRFAQTLAWSLRAHVLAAQDSAAQALEALDRADWPGAADVTIAEAADRLLRAGLLERLGRDQEALGWYASIAQRAAYELVYLAPSELRQAEILERLGDGDSAIPHYRRFVELWLGADPVLQPQVRAAAARTEALSRAASP